MLKFRFRKQNLRRRSNSCPNLERQDDEICVSPGHNANSCKDTLSKEHTDNLSFESVSENESETLPKKERLKVQRSIRRVKKREKEKQENSEKNLLSMDDYYGKLALLKEWLLEQGKKEIDKISSPKLKSHFKTFIKLWNKRKLPAQFYRSCCVDSVEALSALNNPSSPASPVPQLYGDMNKLASYHRFPPVDEPDISWRSLLGTPSPFKPRPSTMTDSVESPLFTFGKSTEDLKSLDSFPSFQILQSIDNQTRKKETTLVTACTQVAKGSSVTSPNKFAMISRSMFKPSGTTLSPKLHPVLSPTCPLTSFPFSDRTKTLQSSFSMGTINSPVEGRRSPAYMSVKDAIHYESPEYAQIREFESGNIEPAYCSLSLLHQESRQDATTSHGQRKNPALNRRRSKSMEDIYAVPSRLNSMKTEPFSLALHERSMSTTPPIPEKNFSQQKPDGFWDSAQTFTTALPKQFNTIRSGYVSHTSHIQNYDAEYDLKEGINICSVQEMKNPELYESRLNTNSTTGLMPSTKSDCSPSVLPNKPGSKRRSQDKENVDAESLEEFQKKTKALESNHQAAQTKTTPSILTGSLKVTTRTPSKNQKPKTNSTRLSILQIKQLDSSPTFPRRRIKRRSSNLTTTPGKNLTFGSNTPSYAKSSPRCVSFAKDVKDTDKKNTPTRRSGGRHIAKERNTLNEVKRQSHDKLEFESFWSNPSGTKDKNSSPKQGSPGKVWSPPKTLSLSDHHPKISTIATGGSESWEISPDKQTVSLSASKNPALSEGSSPRKAVPLGQSQDFGFSLSLSPSKIVSRLKQSISSSSLLQKNYVTCKNKNIAGADQRTTSSVEKTISYPKSILKKKDSVEFVSDNPTSIISTEGEKILPTRQAGRRVLGPPSSTSFRDNTNQTICSTMKPVNFNFRLQRDFKTSNSRLNLDQAPKIIAEFDKYLISKRQANNLHASENVTHLDKKPNQHVEVTGNLFDKMSPKMFPNDAEFRDYTSDKTDSPNTLPTTDVHLYVPKSKTEISPINEHEQSHVQCIKLDMKERPNNDDKSNIFEDKWLFKEDGKDSTQNAKNTFDQEGDYALKGYNQTITHIDDSATLFNDNSAMTRNIVPSHNLSTPTDDDDSCEQFALNHDLSPTTPLETNVLEFHHGSPDVDFHRQSITEDNRKCQLGRFESMKASLNVVENDSWITARRKNSVKHRERKCPSNSASCSHSTDGVSTTESDFIDSSQSSSFPNTDDTTQTSQSNIFHSSDQECNIGDGQTFAFDIVSDADSCPIIDCTTSASEKDVGSATAQSISSSQTVTLGIECDHPSQVEPETESTKEIPKVNKVNNFDTKPSFCIDGNNKKECDTANNESKERPSKSIKPKPKPAVLPKPSVRSRCNASCSELKSTAGNVVSSRSTIKKQISIILRETQGNSTPLSNHDTGKKKVFAERKSKGSLQDSKNLNPLNQERRRSSLTPKKRRSGSRESSQTRHPHAASFAQRRKFFQQKEETHVSSTSGNMTSKLTTQSLSGNMTSKLTTQSLSGNMTSKLTTQSLSRLQTKPKPQVKPKPRRSKISSSMKGLSTPS